MSDESSYTAVGDEALEARIVAWVLGEASAFEAEELEKLCVEREELGVFKRRIERMHGLMEAEVREGVDEAWSLPEAKRSAVEQLLENGEEKARERSVRRSGRRAMVAIAACVVVSLFGVWMMPRGYEGKVVVEVRPRAGGMSPLGEGMRDDSGPMSAQFFGTEFEKIKSRESLEKVVENLDLDARWGVDKEDALGRLRGIVDAQNIRGTDLVEIKVRDANKGDAKEIAEEVAETYAAYRREWETEESRRSLEELKKAIRDQEEKVEERRKVLATIVRTKGVIHKGEDRFYGRGGEGEQREETVKRGLDAQDYVDAKRAFETDVALLQEMKIKQIAETISSETPAGNAVIVHDSSVEDRSLFQLPFGGKAEGTVAEAPTVTTYSAALAEQEEKGQDEDGEGMVALKTEFPAEMIEGTPKPMNVPGLVDERDGPVIAGRMRYGREQKKQDSNWKESSNGVVVGGQVLSPGTVNFADGMKLGDAVDGAGGATDFGSKRRVRVMRDGVLKQYDLNSKVGRELQLQAGDVVEVPQKSVFGDGERLPGNERLRGRPEAAVDFAKTAPVQSAPAAWVSGVADRERTAGKSSSSSELADGGADEGGVGVETRYFFSDADGGVKAVPEPAARPQPRPVVRKPVVASGGVAADEAAVSSSLFAEAGKHDSKQNVDAFAASDVPEVADVPMLGRMFRSKEKGRKVDVNGRERELPDLSNAATMAENRTRVDEVRKDLDLAEGNLKLGKLDVAKRKYEDALGVDPGNQAARRGLEKLAKQEAASYRAAYDSTRAELLAEVDAAWELKVPAEVVEFEGFINYGAPIDGVAGKDGVDADAFNANATDGDDWSGVIRDKLEADLEVVDGEVEKLAEQAELENRPAVAPARKPVVFEEENSAAEEPYSTFSLNISDASFQVAQAALARGEQPDPAGIKVEQFYNGVDYGDPGPVGDVPVAVTIEQAAHPVVPGRNLVRVAVKTAAAGRGEGQPLRLTLLVDQSGSMAREDRRGAMDEALGGLAELLTENDRVSVIGFSRRARLLAEAMGGEKADGLAELVNQGAAEGGTNLEEAIGLAEEIALRGMQAGAQNRIVLFTDGAANLGDADPERLAEKVKELRQKGLALDIAGIAADDLNDDLLAELARHGNGRYYVVGKAGKGGEAELAKKLAGAFRPAAENVKVQVRFNPERVGRYKLIGFEKDRLQKEDFRNDAVDAAEMAAEEAGVAIYQVEPLAEGSGEIGEVSVRFRDVASGEMVERSWTVPHDEMAPAIDRASPSMQLAVLAMLAGEKLRGGPLGEAVDFGEFTDVKAKVREFYGSSGRVAEVLEMVEALRK